MEGGVISDIKQEWRKDEFFRRTDGTITNKTYPNNKLIRILLLNK